MVLRNYLISGTWSEVLYKLIRETGVWHAQKTNELSCTRERMHGSIKFRQCSWLSERQKAPPAVIPFHLAQFVNR